MLIDLIIVKGISIFENSVNNLSGNNILVGGVKLNEGENPLWDKHGINTVPTLIAFSKNNIKNRKDAKMEVGLTMSDMGAILSSIGTIGKSFSRWSYLFIYLTFENYYTVMFEMEWWAWQKEMVWWWYVQHKQIFEIKGET